MLNLSNTIWLLVRSGNVDDVISTFRKEIGIEKVVPYDGTTPFHPYVRLIRLDENLTFIGGWGLPYNSKNSVVNRVRIMEQVNKAFSVAHGESQFYICDDSQLVFGWMDHKNGKLSRSYIFGYDENSFSRQVLLENSGMITEAEREVASNFYLKNISDSEKSRDARKMAVYQLASLWNYPVSEREEIDDDIETITYGYDIGHLKDKGILIQPDKNSKWFHTIPERGEFRADAIDPSDHTYESAVISGKGWGAVQLMARREIVDTFLNDEGTPRGKYDDVYFVEYPRFGIIAQYRNDTHRLSSIEFCNRDEDCPHLNGFPLQTDKGIGWNSSKREVEKAYGKPVQKFSGKKLFNNQERWVYQGIFFRFIGRKMVKIGIVR